MKLKRLLSLAVLCVAGVGSSWADNSAGKATSLPNGVYFLKSVDNTYISRGGNYNTEATLDEFGLAVNITTDNNVSKLLFVDANKPLFSTDQGTVFTDGDTNNENSKWTVTAVDGGYTLYNIATSKYLVPGNDGNYIVAKQGTSPLVWTIETAEQHAAVMTKLKNTKAAQVATAAGIKASTPEEIETAVSTWSIKTNVTIPSIETKEFYQNGGTRDGNINITKVGLYKFSIPAYSRVSWPDHAYDMHQNKTENIVAYIYFGNEKTQIRSLYSEEGKSVETANYNKPANATLWYADRTNAGTADFNEGKYTNDVWVYISEPGNYKYGIVNTSKGVCGDWIWYGTPKLTYYQEKTNLPGTDLTNNIKNPGFETGDLTGWTTEQSNDTGVKDANNETYKAQGSEGNKLFNTWSDGKALTQNIGKLEAGIYELSAMLATGDNPNSKGTVYLTVNDTKSAGMVSRNGNKQVMHKETLTFVSDGKTETTIGAVGIEIGNGHWWYKADDFKLTFVDNTNNLFKVLTDVIANTEPWTTNGEYVNKYNEYKGLTETSAQADILSAINYLKTNYDNYAWENASVEHPYLMSNVIAKAELNDNGPWLGSGRLTKPNTDHWSGGKKTVFVQNSGEYARKQAITVPYSGGYLLKTAVRTFTDKAFANIKMGDVVSSTNTKTGNTGGNVNIDGTEGTNNRANGNAGYGWTFNNLNYWCDADNTNTEIAIQLSTVSDDFSRGNEAQASGMFLYYVGQTYEQVKNGVHYYYGEWEANDVASELTNETPILDLTKATINGTVAIKATNKNGLVYTNSVNSLSGIDNNIVKDGICANLMLTDGYPFTATKNFEATKATYTMTAIADGKFGTLVLPFAAQLPADGKAYALDGELNVIDGELVGSAVTSLAANKPVLVTKAGEYTASAVSVAETSASQINTNGNLTGVYQNTEAPVGSYVLQNHPATQGVAFYLVGEVKPTVKPFRAFIPAQDAKVKAIKVVFDGEATGIKEINSDNTKAEIFDLSGRRVAKAQKGVYIINGKKVIKK